MNSKQLNQMLKKLPKTTLIKIQQAGEDKSYEVELKFDSELGWLLVFKLKT